MWSFEAVRVSSVVAMAAVMVLLVGQTGALPISNKIRRDKRVTSKPEEESPVIVVPGIKNSGNTCFLNALLQALSCSPQFVSFMEYLDYFLSINAVDSGATCLSRSLWAALRELRPKKMFRSTEREGENQFWFANSFMSQSNLRVILDFSTLDKKLRAISPTFKFANEQHDVDELLAILLELMGKEVLRTEKSLICNLASNGIGLLIKSEEAQKLHEAIQRSPTLINPVQGTLFSLIQCKRCYRQSPLLSTPFSVLSVSIPFEGSSIEECLHSFTSVENLEGVDCPRCAKVKGRNPRQDAWKRLMIGKLPHVLCLRFQRNLYDTRQGRMYKDRRTVNVRKILDISKSCFFSILVKEHHHRIIKTEQTSTVSSQLINPMLPLFFRPRYNQVTIGPQPVTVPFSKSSTTKNTQYQLVAVVEHLGSAFGGHYVTYRRIVESTKPSFWVRCSDDNITVVDEHQVLTSVQHYMCIYEKL